MNNKMNIPQGKNKGCPIRNDIFGGKKTQVLTRKIKHLRNDIFGWGLKRKTMRKTKHLFSQNLFEQK